MNIMRSRMQTAATAIFRRPGKLETIGAQSGSWTIPSGLISPSSICYCVGCGEDVSFDATLADRFQCNVWSYDPTPRAKTHIVELRERTINGQIMEINGNKAQLYELSTEALDRWHFEPLGVWSKNEVMRFYAPANEEHVSHSVLNLQKTEHYFEADCRTLWSLMADNGHDHIDLLKLDIEGAEYEVIKSLKDHSIRPAILCVEFDEGHNQMDAGARDRIESSMKILSSMGYWMAHRANWDFTFVL